VSRFGSVTLPQLELVSSSYRILEGNDVIHKINSSYFQKTEYSGTYITAVAFVYFLIMTVCPGDRSDEVNRHTYVFHGA